MSPASPGLKSQRLAALLERYGSRGAHVATHSPIFWESAEDARIIDVDGNAYLDLCAAFGVAALGHSNPNVARAIGDQAARLMHAMGDLYPAGLLGQLLEKLAEISPGDLSKSLLCSTGTEAVEAALKTALLYNGRPGIIAFNGAYHGLSLGALEVCGLPFFRKPFEPALTHRGIFFDYPRAGGQSAVDRTMTAIREKLRDDRAVGALIVEPIQGRGGIVLPPDGFLRALRALCDEEGVVLIFDEIYTGLGRTGAFFAAQHEQVVPDIMCVGKALGNGFPISAAIAKPQIMDAWPAAGSEALHTSTFLGNPMGCAAALATIDQLQRRRLPERARELGERVQHRLETLRGKDSVVDVRGRGLFWGVEMRDVQTAQAIVQDALRHKLMAFAEGAVIAIMPPLTISEERLDQGLDILTSVIADYAVTGTR